MGDTTSALPGGDLRQPVTCFFEVYRCHPEATFDVPAFAPGQPPLTIAVAAAGGGTVGQRYAHQDWIYSIHLDSQLVASGADLRTGAIAHTHRQMAAILAAGLTRDCPAVLAPHQDRLSRWAADTNPPPHN